ncbi:MAG: hypothetical protein LBK82_17345 [Planctomycetaceae bacterium]|nr:hypothetical protein [Planctomycetaceae bacterium]
MAICVDNGFGIRLESGAKSANADVTFQRKVTHLVICLPLTKITIPVGDT